MIYPAMTRSQGKDYVQSRLAGDAPSFTPFEKGEGKPGKGIGKRRISRPAATWFCCCRACCH